EDVGRNRLAEGHRVALEDTLADGAARRQRREVDRLPRKARDAADAADQHRIAVDLEERAATRRPVQVVDVLRDGAAEHTELLELDQRLMARVRTGRREGL